MSALDDLNMLPDLIHQVQPIDGEGLGELLLRATSVNGYQKADWILSLCGLKGTRLSHLVSVPPTDLAPLAKVLGLKCGENELVHLLHPNATEVPGWISFFGTQLRLKYLDLVNRRVSPRALRHSGHLRAMWAIKILSFDPGTKELLLDHCPVCDRKLNFRSVIEIWSCAYCERVDHEGFKRAAVDLRDFPQPLVEVDDVEALDFVTGLVDSEARVRASFQPKLHRDLEAMSRGELFETTVAICCALRGDKGGETLSRSLWRPRDSEGYRSFTPQLFAKAGRALLGWPEEFHRLAEEVRNTAGERPGHYGIQKELGPLLAITFDSKVPRLARILVRKLLEDNMAMTACVLPTVRGAKHRHRADLITMQDAADELSCGRQSMSKLSRYPGIEVFRSPVRNSPVLFRRKQIEEILELKSQLLPSAQVAVELGVPRSALRELSLAGMLARESGPVIEFLLGNDYYHAASAACLVSAVQEKIRVDTPPKTFVRLTRAVNRLPSAPPNAWAAIFEGILNGSVAVWRIEGRLTALMTSLAVSNMSDVTGLFPGFDEAVVPEALRLTQSEAASLLGTTPHNICALAASGFLPERITSADVSRFSAQFALTGDVLELLREKGKVMSPRILVQKMKAEGFNPQAILSCGGKLVWRLNDVSTFIDLIANSPSLQMNTVAEAPADKLAAATCL